MPIHYLNQSWNIDNRTPRNNRPWHFNWKSYIFIQEKHLNMSSAKRLAFCHSSNTLKCWIRLKILSCICILYHTSTLKCPRLKRFSFQEDRIYLYFTSLISVLLMSYIILICREQAMVLTSSLCSCSADHDDVIKWKHFPRYWTFVRGINRWPLDSPIKGQWCGFFDLRLNKRMSKQWTPVIWDTIALIMTSQ